jgi:predicted transcriptional regulator
MRTERPPDSTGIGLQERPPRAGDDHPRRTAMTLQLTDDEVAALQAQARAEHRSAEDVAADAVREYAARNAHRILVQAATERVVERYAEALRGLGQR